MPRRKDPNELRAQQQRILNASSTLLQAEGPAAITNRRVAAAAGCTTMAIYSRFGGKNGILDALFSEGVARISQAQAQASASSEDPLDALVVLVLAYRQAALTYRGHYQLMFGKPIPDYSPSDENRAQLLVTYTRLQQVVAPLVPSDLVDAITYQIFATCHGFIMLELAEMTAIIPDPAALYRDAVRRLVQAPARQIGA